MCTQGSVPVQVTCEKRNRIIGLKEDKDPEEHDPRCRRKIHERIKEGERKKANGVLIVIESPLMTYGFAVFYDRQSPVQKSKLVDRRDSSYGLKVMPISVVRIDDRYLAQRNMPNSKTLAGKNIAVVGCGTIGGCLSEMLVKAGAGTC